VVFHRLKLEIPMTKKTKRMFAFIATFIAIFEVAFFRVNMLEFARLDDFAGLINVRTDTLLDGVFHTSFQAGRSLSAIFQAMLFLSADSVSDLKVQRFIATASLALGGAIIALFVWSLSSRKSLVTLVLAACVGVVATTTTSAPSASTWAILAVPLLALPLALAGGVIAVTNKTYLKLPWWALSATLVFASAFTYQQFTPLAFLPVGMWLTVQCTSRQKIQLCRAVFITAIIFTSLLVNAATVLLIGDGAQERVLRGTISERLRWFIGTYVPRTIDLFIPATRETGVLSLLILVAALLLPVVFGIRFLSVMVSGITSWGICAAVAFPAEFWASYRLIHPAQIALWTSAAFGLFIMLSRFDKKSIAIFAAFGALLLIFQSQDRAWRYVAIPNHDDWATTKCQIKRKPDVNTFVVSEWNSSNSGVHSYDEYGMVPSNYDWTFDLSVRIARLELNSDGESVNTSMKPKMISVEDARALAPGTYIAITPPACR
jgi:hypothetical protein